VRSAFGDRALASHAAVMASGDFAVRFGAKRSEPTRSVDQNRRDFS
jgi:hypothetical protein